MILRYTPDARESVRVKHRWWRAHRDEADLFARELRGILEKLRNNVDTARQRYAGDGAATVWRMLMPKTRHHVYYRRDDQAGITTVLLVANAIAETGPNL